jgi:hypothetical protein
MAEKRENSVLFSLRELKNIEEDRVREEDDAQKARADAEHAAREAELRRQADERARMERDAQEAEERRLMEIERQRREEGLRLEEGERKARVEAQMKLEESRLKMEIEARAVHGARKKPVGLIAVAVVLFLAVGGLGIFAYNKHLENEKKNADILLAQADAKAQKEAFDKEMADLEIKNDLIDQEINKKVTEIASAKSDEERHAKQKEIQDLQNQKKANTERVKNIRSGTAKPTTKGIGPIKICPADKPLC